MTKADLPPGPAHLHGGNLAAAMARFGGAPGDGLRIGSCADGRPATRLEDALRALPR